MLQMSQSHPTLTPLGLFLRHFFHSPLSIESLSQGSCWCCGTKCNYIYRNLSGYAPVTVLTQQHRLRDREDVDKVFQEASLATGSSSEDIYFIDNYEHAKAEQSEAVDRAALSILDSALLSAERFIRISKQREKNEMDRDVVAGGNRFYLNFWLNVRQLNGCIMFAPNPSSIYRMFFTDKSRIWPKLPTSVL